MRFTAGSGLGEQIFDEVGYTPRYVTVTGGEPLAQRACIGLLKQLCDRGYQVSLETSGALMSAVDPRVVIVMIRPRFRRGDQEPLREYRRSSPRTR